jgi:UMF1 family MFS transporter
MSELTISGRPVASRAARLAWMFFDWAAQPFFTLVTTFVFAPYFANHVAGNATDGQQIWGVAAGTAGLIIALFSPIFGALGDVAGARKPWIAAFSVLAVLGSVALYFAVPGGEYAIAIGVTGFIVGTIGFEFATNFNNAMMPELVSRSDLGRLSGSGWALGYAGGIVCLFIVLGFMSADPETGLTLFNIAPILGLDPSTYEGDRATGPFTAIWYVIFITPMFVLVKDAPKRGNVAGALRKSLAELWRRAKALPARRSYFAFLVTSMIYREGLNTVFVFGGIYAAGVLGMTIMQLGVFGILVALTGAAGAWTGGVLDQRFGPKPVVATSCVVLAAAALAVISLSQESILFFIPVAADSDAPLTGFYIAGAIIGAAGGALQAASRTLLVDQVEPGEVAEAFGFFALTGKASNFIGPYLVALITALTQSQRWGVTPVIVLLAAGAVGLIWVRQKSPHAA